MWFVAAAAFAADALAPAASAEAQLTLTAPRDYQVFQRAEITNGVMVVEGQWSVPPRAAAIPDALVARVLPPGSNAGADSEWKPLAFDGRAHGFRAALPVPPGGWYRVQVRLLQAGVALASADIAHVGVGEVFFIAGQSNAANYGEARLQPASGLVTAFDGEHWAPANDPQPGATGTKGSFIPSFGDALVRELHVPVGVVCLGVGSTSVREWTPAGHPMSAPPTTGAHCVALVGGKLVSSGELFTRLAGRLRQFPPHGVRAVLWHQGESDWKQPEGHDIPLAEYRADLTDLIAASRTAAGWEVPWFVAQVSYGSPGQPGAAEMRAQQLAVVDGRLTLAGPNTDALTGVWRERNGQGVHFNAAGLQRHGELWAEIIGPWIASDRVNEK
jgi:hypothetical protein